MKILVLILAALGDTLFTTPSLKALRNSYPEADIDVVCWEENRDILSGNKNIDNLISCRGNGQLLAELHNLRDSVYDISFGLSTTGSFISYLVNARWKLGFKGEELGWIYNCNVPDNRNLHAVDYCLEIVKTAGARPDRDPQLELPVEESDHYMALEKLHHYGFKGELPLVVIHPGGKYFSYKRWPGEYFKKLLKILDSTYNLKIVLIGGNEDRKIAQSLVDNYHNYKNRPQVLAGELKLKETAALLSHAEFFIGNDSAPLHMAAASGIPVIALFGPTNPDNYYPYGTTYKIIRADLPCLPCFSWLGELKQYLPEYLPEWAHKCKGRCMEEIHPEMVLDGITRFEIEGKVDLSRRKLALSGGGLI